MKNLSLLFFTIIVFGCNEPKSTQSDTKDSISIDTLVESTTQTNPSPVNLDSFVMNLTVQVLTSLKNKDYIQFAGFIHPTLGVRFSPYGYIDTANHLVLNSKKF